MTTIEVQLGRAIRRLRAEAGYSQEAFAAQVRVHRTYMGLIERGRVSMTVHTVERIAAALSIRMSELLAAAEAVDDTAEDADR